MPKHYRPPGKKKEGNAAKYVTRSQAVKQLQASLPVFRKLCILKGVFPREPKKKVKGNHQTYYHTKDILHLQHDPLLEQFREIRAHGKKVKKALAKKNKDRANRLLSQQPTYVLDRLIKERYPRFIDALGDLDDCLTLVNLFAALATLKDQRVEVTRIHRCRRLSHEWQAYIARTHKLRKTFISVKGIYFQAEVEGQKITWVTPHALQQVLTDDIDFNIMLTFLEFNETLLAFANFKLYHSINVKYPPILDPRLEALAADLSALSRYIASKYGAASSELQTVKQDDQQKLTELDESKLILAQLQHQLAPNEPGTLMHLVEETEFEDDEDEETKECRSLFKNMRFFLSREVPRESLLFVIFAFGGTVSWEGYGAPFEESDQSITHQIVDRPTQGHIFLSREYIQPQWVFDCVNACIILPTEDYLVGRVPPPHLSPFVDNEAVGYIPDYAEKIKQLQAAARKQVLPVPAVGKEDLDDAHNLLLEGVATRLEAKEAAERKQQMQRHEKQYHEELRMELQSIQPDSGATQLSSSGNTEASGPRESDMDQITEDTAKMDQLVMSRRKRGLLNAMEIGKKRKQANVDVLKSRKQRIEERQKSGKD